MSGSSGGGGYQPQDNSLQIEMMRQQSAAAETARQDKLKEEARTKFTSDLETAAKGAKQTGLNYLGQRGLSADSYGSIIDSIIGNTRLKVPDLSTNVGQYFTDDTFASGLDNYQATQRGNYTGQVNSKFAPGFEKSLISDSADDSIINSILNTQRGGAQQQLDFNRARGLLNDSGYNEAQQELGRQESAGRSTLNNIGNSVLGTKRQGLLDIRGNAGNAASGYTLGQAAPNFDTYYNEAKTRAAGDLSDLEGSIRSSLGGTNLFDVPTALAKGGTMQGPMNLTTAETIPGLPTIQKKQTNRGLGSTGNF